MTSQNSSDSTTDDAVSRQKIIDVFHSSTELFKKHQMHYGYVYQNWFPELYQLALKITQFADHQHPSFRARLSLILHDVYEIPICMHQDCHNEVNVSHIRINHDIPHFCSSKCRMSSDMMRQYNANVNANRTSEEREDILRRRNATIKLRVAENPNYWKDRRAKTKQTMLQRYGDENYMSFGTESWYQMNEQKHGNRYYANSDKAKETNKNKTDEQKIAIRKKQLDTYNTHKEADPDFVKKIVMKSKATRIANNGEDYTGRGKCKRTMLERYGVENAFQTEVAKEHMKQTNLARYGVEHYSQSDEYNDKVKETSYERYGVSNYSKTDEFKQRIQHASMDRYGVKCPFQADEVKQKIIQTNMERYGVPYTMQNPEIRRKSQRRYVYDGKHFDSFPEIAFYVWLADHQHNFEYQPNVSFTYEFDGKQHKYMPDFIVDGTYFEIKGVQFFEDKDPTKKMVNPYDHSEDALYEAKHQCMQKNDVIILTDADFKPFVDYAMQKFTETELSAMRQSK